jgi:hypothetical protein
MNVLLCLYMTFAVVATIFHGFWCLQIWPVYEGLETTTQKIHQVWFNLSGSATGWLLGYWEIWHRFLPVSAGAPGAQPLGWIDIVLLILALLGMVGYLPNTLAGISRSFTELSKKLAGSS